MARTKRDSGLENRTNRLKLPHRKEPYWAALAPGNHIGYYRPASLAAGSWVGKWRDPDTNTRQKATFGVADDYQDADDQAFLSWAQAQERARKWFQVCSKKAKTGESGSSDPSGDPVTVRTITTDYLTEQRRLGRRGVQQAENAINAHVIGPLGDVLVSRLSRGQLEKWISDLANKPRRKRSKYGSKEPAYQIASTSAEDVRKRRDSANRVWSSLKAALNLAYKRDQVDNNDAWKGVLGFENTTSARIRYLSIPEQVKLVKVCPPDFRRLVTAALHTGARFGELVRLEVSDFDERLGTIHVSATIAKTGKARNIVLTDEAKAFFVSITSGREGSDLILQRDAVERRVHVSAGLAWQKSDQSRPLEAACEAAEIKRCTFHELRHTAASVWINAGMSLGDVAEQLGDSEKTTKKHYVHLCPDALAKRVRSVAPLLGINDLPDAPMPTATEL